MKFIITENYNKYKSALKGDAFADMLVITNKKT